MSYSLFDQGITAEEIQWFKEQRAELERAEQEVKALDQVEPMRSILRFTEADQKVLDQLPQPPCPIKRKPLSNLLR
jgi:hypothetical protein